MVRKTAASASHGSWLEMQNLRHPPTCGSITCVPTSSPRDSYRHHIREHLEMLPPTKGGRRATGWLLHSVGEETEAQRGLATSQSSHRYWQPHRSWQPGPLLPFQHLRPTQGHDRENLGCCLWARAGNVSWKRGAPRGWEAGALWVAAN